MPDAVALDTVEEVGSSPSHTGAQRLEDLVLLTTTDMVRKLEQDAKKELKQLRERQQKVTFLHKLTKAINAKTDPKGNVNLTNETEIKELMQEAHETLGVEMDLDKNKYTRDELNRLLENLRMTADDLNMHNDMQIQTITRLTNERYEAFQLARSIFKPLHEAKVNKARAIAGR